MEESEDRFPLLFFVGDVVANRTRDVGSGCCCCVEEEEGWL